MYFIDLSMMLFTALIAFTLTAAEFGSLTMSQLVEKVRGLQELAFQLGLEEGCEVFVL